MVFITNNNTQLKSKAEPSVSLEFHNEDPKQFRLRNVRNLEHLNIESKHLPFEVYEADEKNAYDVKLLPEEGSEHTVSVQYKGQDVEQTPFLLCKAPPVFEHDTDNKMITLKNIYNKDKVEVHSKTLSFEEIPTNEKQTVKLQYNIEDKNKIHDFDILFDNKPVENASVRLVPKALCKQYEAGLLTDQHDNIIENVQKSNNQKKLIFSHNPLSQTTEQMKNMSLNKAESDHNYELYDNMSEDNDVSEADSAYESEHSESEEEATAPTQSIKINDKNMEQKRLLVQSNTPNRQSNLNKQMSRQPVYQNIPKSNTLNTLYPPPPSQRNGRRNY